MAISKGLQVNNPYPFSTIVYVCRYKISIYISLGYVIKVKPHSKRWYVDVHCGSVKERISEHTPDVYDENSASLTRTTYSPRILFMDTSVAFSCVLFESQHIDVFY